MQQVTLILPWPPTFNEHWTKRGGRAVSTAAGKRFDRLVGLAVRSQFPWQPISRQVAVLIETWPPVAINWTWDLDNRIKPTLDALTKAALWIDDSQVRDLRIVSGNESQRPASIGRGGGLRVTVWPNKERNDGKEESSTGRRSDRRAGTLRTGRS
jgi:crossover junction endodeoxyribonuclease RusA